MKELRHLRKRKGYLVTYMAKKLNISSPFYSQIESTKRRLSYVMAIKISKIFDMKPDELFYKYFSEMMN